METMKKLADTCMLQMESYPVITGKEKVKRAVKKNLLGQKVAPIDRFSWPNAMLGEGLLEAYEAVSEKKYLDAVIKYLERWKKEGFCINYVDNLMNGSLALWIEELIQGKASGLYGDSEKEQILTLCRDAAEKCAGWVRLAKKTEEGALAYRQQHANWLFADTIGMACPFLCRYGVQKKDEELLNLGILQIQAFLKHGMDRRSGLPYHGYDELDGTKYGIIGWGRACGWVMKGMAESIQWIPSKMKEKRQLKLAFWNLKDSVARYQRRDGGFSWQVQAVEGPVDTSAGAMIGNAIWTVSQKSEIKQETMRIQEQLSDSFLISITGGEVRNCSGECHGFAEYPQVYGSYPWGNGSVLRCMALKVNVMLELKNRPVEEKAEESRPAKADKGEKAAKPVKAEKVEKPEKQEKKTSGPKKIEKDRKKESDSEKSGKMTEESEKPEKSENRIAEAERTEKSEKTGENYRRKRKHNNHHRRSGKTEPVDGNGEKIAASNEKAAEPVGSTGSSDAAKG